MNDPNANKDDRLHRFEDIGLEPDEIKLKLQELERLKSQIHKINELSRTARYSVDSAHRAIIDLATEAEIHT